MDLLNQKCIPCGAGSPPLTADKAQELFVQLTPGWEIMESKKIKKEFKFKEFMDAIAFVNKVATIAEDEGHHPDIYIFYNLVRIELWTHAVNGLSENDFIVAAKIDQLR